MKMIKDGSFTALAQRHDSEQELLTACADGRILCWDRDYDEPVMVCGAPPLPPSPEAGCADGGRARDGR